MSLKKQKQQFTGDLQQDGDAANIYGEEEYFKLVKIRDREKGETQPTEITTEIFCTVLKWSLH